MQLIVTGASGFVGRALLPALTAAGHDGIATGREAPHPLPAGWFGKRRGDLLTELHTAGGIEAIVHLEVKQHVPLPRAKDIAEFETVNVEGTRVWLEWAEAHSIRRFIYVSSIKAVGAGDGIHRESDASLPDTPYGKSKATAEEIVRAWAKNGADRVATILRPAPVYGPGNEANLAAFARQIWRGRPCFVGDGRTRKSIVGLRNLVAAIEFAIDRDPAGCDVFNVSDLRILSVRELAEFIAELGNWPRPRGLPSLAAKAIAPIGDVIEWLTGRPFPLTTARLRALVEETVFPCDKLVAAGFRHPASLRDGLREMLDWAISSRGFQAPGS